MQGFRIECEIDLCERYAQKCTLRHKQKAVKLACADGGASAAGAQPEWRIAQTDDGECLCIQKTGGLIGFRGVDRQLFSDVRGGKEPSVGQTFGCSLWHAASRQGWKIDCILERLDTERIALRRGAGGCRAACIRLVARRGDLDHGVCAGTALGGGDTFDVREGPDVGGQEKITAENSDVVKFLAAEIVIAGPLHRRLGDFETGEKACAQK